VDFEDSTWQSPRLLPVAAPKGVEGHTPYELMPAATPPLRRTWREAERQAWPLTIPPHTKRTILLDFGHLTFGWIHAAWTGGQGSRMTLRYAEALRLKDEPKKKGHRNQTEGKIALGPWDEIHPDGAARKMKMLHPRAARFIELTVETAEEPLNVDGLRIEETTFPASLRAAFEADDPVLERIFVAGWRTLELGAQDTFVSDLGWERMQYIGDTMVQAMAWLAATGDDRLVRLAIEQFDASRLPEGLTQSRYPANLVQLTPIYSLAWIHMVCDYHLYRGDRQFLEARLPGIRAVLEWFQRNRNAEGLLGALPGLDFVDHAYSARYREILSEKREPVIAVHNLFYAWTLNRAASLAEALRLTREAAEWRAEGRRVNEKIRRLCWSRERNLFADSPSRRTFSQHVNLLAVLSGAVGAKEKKPLMERVLSDDSLLGVELYYRYFLHRALREAGLAERYPAMTGPWRRMLEAGMTTFGETDAEPRSECHPWSASPVFDLLSLTAGIEPSRPGFSAAVIAPAPGPLRRIRAVYPHPRGEIRLELVRCGAGVRARIDVPDGLPAVFRWAGVKKPLRPGRNEIRIGSAGELAACDLP
jgi:hypothetical protein